MARPKTLFLNAVLPRPEKPTPRCSKIVFPGPTNTSAFTLDDAGYRADVYQQIMMNLSWSHFLQFHADAEHPDWGPLWNPVYRDQPNPDDIYLYTPIRGDLTYRISGQRGTCALLTFNTAKG